MDPRLDTPWIRFRVWLHWRIAELRCVVRGHRPAEFGVMVGRLADIEAGLVAQTMQYRCDTCWREFDRP